MSSVDTESLATNLDAFYLFLFIFFIAVANNGSTMLNKSDKSGHPHLVPDFRGKALGFFPFENDVSCGFFIYGLRYVGVCSL